MIGHTPLGFSLRNKPLLNANRNKLRQIKIALLCKGQCTGQEDVLNNRNYTCTVRCLSEGSVFVIKAQEFLHKMAKDEKTWKIIKDQCVHKDKNTRHKVIQAEKKFSFSDDDNELSLSEPRF